MAGAQYPIHVALPKIAYRLLTNPRGWRVSDLKEELRIADSTYRKYRKILREDFDFLFDENGQSRVEEVRDGDERYLRLREMGEAEERERIPQVIALYLAKSTLNFLKETDLFREADGFYQELMRSKKGLGFLPHLFENIDRMIFTIPYAPKDYSDKNDIIKTILHGIFFRKKIRIVHKALGAEKPREHLLQPWTLLMWQSGLYLVGKGPKYKQPATYAVERIESAVLTKEKFAYPSDYSPSIMMDGSFGIFREMDTKHNVELIFENDPLLKERLKSRRWHPTQQFIDMPDGKLKMTFTVNSLVEVEPWVRSFGNDVTLFTGE